MKNLIVAAILSLTFFSACKKKEGTKEIPACIQQRLDEGIDPLCDSGASVDKFIFQEKTVYVFSPGDCGADMASQVVDADCNELGILGGIAGIDKINGEKFSHAVFVENVWGN